MRDIKKNRTEKEKKELRKASKSLVGSSTREKMIARKKELKERSQGGGMIYPKEGTLRVRVKSRGSDEELGLEIIQFYLGPKEGGIISPATFDEPCPFMEAYKRLKESKDELDQQLATKITPRRRYVIGVIAYRDEKGKEIDPDRIDKPCLIPRSVYQDIIDLYLDEDEWGDMTDPDEGYDIKITRSGSGKMDTSYSVSPCQKKALNPKYVGEVDLEGIVRKQILPYDELEEKLNDFLQGVDVEEADEDDERPRKKRDREDRDRKKKKYKGDI